MTADYILQEVYCVLYSNRIYVIFTHCITLAKVVPRIVSNVLSYFNRRISSILLYVLVVHFCANDVSVFCGVWVVYRSCRKTQLSRLKSAQCTGDIIMNYFVGMRLYTILTVAGNIGYVRWLYFLS